MPLRQRKEIQKMSRRRIAVFFPAFLLLIPAAAGAAIWPDTLAGFQRATAQGVGFQSNHAVWDEYGLKEGEEAQYQTGSQKFTATAWRFEDPTGALAAFEWMRLPDSKPSSIAKWAAETAKVTLLVHGNYVLRFVGYRPTTPDLDALVQNLKQQDTSSFPSFIDYMPDQDRVPNSERYIEGPAALHQFDPGIPPSAAAFHLSAEAQLASFREPGGDINLALFNYPTPQIARLQTTEFQKIPGAMVKRSGPLVAVILSPPNADAAERLLSLVRYQADITRDERVSTRRDNIGDLVINAFVLIGILLCFSVVGGLAVGGVRAFLHRGPRGDEADALTVLHLQDR
jgi:hypothetical protein